MLTRCPADVAPCHNACLPTVPELHKHSLYRVSRVCLLLSIDSDFTVEGFEAVLEYLYTSGVEGASDGKYSIAKMEATVQAADFFGLPKLISRVKKWAALCGLDEA